ncbi:MAG TPA: GNAT family N-acetyltransferase [Vicinamibacterales bacterium]
MIRSCTSHDFDAMFEVINDGAQAYRGHIADDCWHDPYMPREELRDEIAAGVRFWGDFDGDALRAVMGIQDVKDVALIRHAYTRRAAQGKGSGGRLLAHLVSLTDRPILIGTWASAAWAIRFYEARGFTLVDPEEKLRLLKKYWTVSDRQIAESVVLRNRVVAS